MGGEDDIDADPNTVGNQAFTWASGGFAGQAGQAFLSYDAGTGLTTLALDIDGDGVADYEIRLEGNVSESDHFLIWAGMRTPGPPVR